MRDDDKQKYQKPPSEFEAESMCGCNDGYWVLGRSAASSRREAVSSDSMGPLAVTLQPQCANLPEAPGYSERPRTSSAPSEIRKSSPVAD